MHDNTVTEIKRLTRNYPYDIIDHTCLQEEATQLDIRKAISTSNENSCASVCIRPQWVAYAKKYSYVPITTVIGFPTGKETIDEKVKETQQSVTDGADEIDLVINIDKIKEHDYSYIENEINEVRKVCPSQVLKIIIESALLSTDEIVAATLLTEKCGADYVKTSTGTVGGATVEAVALMRETCPKLRIKASGGIRSIHDINVMVSAGANRIGMSNTGILLETTLQQETGHTSY